MPPFLCKSKKGLTANLQLSFISLNPIDHKRRILIKKDAAYSFNFLHSFIGKL